MLLKTMCTFLAKAQKKMHNLMTLPTIIMNIYQES